jgi:hypothetical protein
MAAECASNEAVTAASGTVVAAQCQHSDCLVPASASTAPACAVYGACVQAVLHSDGRTDGEATVDYGNMIRQTLAEAQPGLESGLEPGICIPGVCQGVHMPGQDDRPGARTRPARDTNGAVGHSPDVCGKRHACVRSLITGRLTKRVVCTECECACESLERFEHLSLPCVGKASLVGMLSAYMAPARLCGVGEQPACAILSCVRMLGWSWICAYVCMHVCKHVTH